MNIIKSIRQTTGLSQVAFGKKYHIPRRTIESWEMAHREPPEYVVFLLATVVSLEYKSKVLSPTEFSDIVSDISAQMSKETNK